MLILDIGTGYQYRKPPIEIISDSMVLCFEPLEEAFNCLTLNKQENVKIIQKAVSDHTGVSKYNIIGIDGSFSSLLDLSDGAFNNWPGKNDLVVSKQINVSVTRLDDYIDIEKIEIKNIDYISITAQGSDIKVIESLGKYIDIIDRGHLLSSIIPESLYKTQNTIHDSIKYLESKHFKITNIEPLDEYGNQAKIYFEKI